MKTVGKIMAIIIVIAIIAAASQIPPSYEESSPYIGRLILPGLAKTSTYYFDSYEKEGNTYTLYKDTRVVGEITVREGSFAIHRRDWRN